MGFFYDKMGLTYEGAAVASILVTFAVIGTGKLICKVRKYMQRRKVTKEVKTLLQLPENEYLREYIKGGNKA